MNTPTNDPLPTELIDAAYDVMCGELDHWQVIGPQRDLKTKQEFYSAVRRIEAQGYAPMILNEPTATRVEHKEFTSKPYAIAYIQWRSLQAVLEAMREHLTQLGTQPNA